jgi:cytidine deaminase
MQQDEQKIRELIELAIKARENAYVPYSNYMVGAALLAKSGKIYTGCNIESCSYTPTTCAERVALVKAVSEGEREFSMIAVIGGPKNGIDPNAPEAAPCGVCRQLIYEFGTDTLVICAKSPDSYYVKPIKELLPHGFGPSHLI